MSRRKRAGARIPPGAWRAWQVPFDTDPDWPQPLQEALAAYRAAWREKRDEVDACIAANAETEELVDKPAVVNGTVRVAGPFTMEGVIAREEGPDSPIGGTPDELEAFDHVVSIVLQRRTGHARRGNERLRVLTEGGRWA